MLLPYSFQGQTYKVFFHWTADSGYSMIYQNIVQEITDRHQLDTGDYWGLAKHLDTLVDKLYKQFYIFINEYSGVPYNPCFRRTVLHIFAEISDIVKECAILDRLGPENPLANLFVDVTNKLQEIMDIYLADNAYQCKFRERMRDKEDYLETTAPSLVSCEFEDILLQMTDLSRIMDCLTDIQRGRLVKHIFLKYTLQEIADHEHASKQAVQGSVTAALKKIRERID